jgi:hypothetical protein
MIMLSNYLDIPRACVYMCVCVCVCVHVCVHVCVCVCVYSVYTYGHRLRDRLFVCVYTYMSTGSGPSARQQHPFSL